MVKSNQQLRGRGNFSSDILSKRNHDRELELRMKSQEKMGKLKLAQNVLGFLFLVKRVDANSKNDLTTLISSVVFSYLLKG